MEVTWRGCTLLLGNGARITLPCNRTMHLPMVSAFKCASTAANVLAMEGCVTNESNQNLTFASEGPVVVAFLT